MENNNSSSDSTLVWEWFATDLHRDRYPLPLDIAWEQAQQCIANGEDGYMPSFETVAKHLKDVGRQYEAARALCLANARYGRDMTSIHQAEVAARVAAEDKIEAVFEAIRQSIKDGEIEADAEWLSSLEEFGFKVVTERTVTLEGTFSVSVKVRDIPFDQDDDELLERLAEALEVTVDVCLGENLGQGMKVDVQFTEFEEFTDSRFED
jgi:hypothetical protein